MKFAASLAFAAVAVCAAAPASAQFAKPEDAIKYRQSALFVMAQHFGRIGAMVNGKAPYDPKAAADSAEIVATMSRLPWAGFGPGTDKGLPTKAKPEVWSDQTNFKEHQDKLLDATPKLLTAARTNDLDTLKGAFGNTAKACKSCHDTFRKD